MDHQKEKPSIIVELNGKKVCKAGICGDGTLDASVRLIDSQAKDDQLANLIMLDVMGISDKKVYTWFHDHKNLKIGDEIKIKIVQSDEIDEPIEVKSIDDCVLNPPWWKFWKRKRFFVSKSQKTSIEASKSDEAE